MKDQQIHKEEIVQAQNILTMKIKELKSAKELDDLRIVHPASKDQDLLKSFRELRSNIYSVSQDQNFVCLVTSVHDQGGASFVAKNLACAIAMERYKTALLIDANFYNSTSSDLFCSLKTIGLTDYLDDPAVSTDTIVHPTFVPRLRIVPVGTLREGGTEKLLFKRLSTFVAEIKNRYPDRMIIIDAPSTLSFSAEVQTLAQLADFCVLVVPDDKVKCPELENAIAVIGREKIAGTVLNRKEV